MSDTDYARRSRARTAINRLGGHKQRDHPTHDI